MSSHLRDKVIRLAYNNPELREHLLPVLKEGGYLDPADARRKKAVSSEHLSIANNTKNQVFGIHVESLAGMGFEQEHGVVSMNSETYQAFADFLSAVENTVLEYITDSNSFHNILWGELGLDPESIERGDVGERQIVQMAQKKMNQDNRFGYEMMMFGDEHGLGFETLNGWFHDPLEAVRKMKIRSLWQKVKEIMWQNIDEEVEKIKESRYQEVFIEELGDGDIQLYDPHQAIEHIESEGDGADWVRERTLELRDLYDSVSPTIEGAKEVQDRAKELEQEAKQRDDVHDWDVDIFDLVAGQASLAIRAMKELKSGRR